MRWIREARVVIYFYTQDKSSRNIEYKKNKIFLDAQFFFYIVLIMQTVYITICSYFAAKHSNRLHSRLFETETCVLNDAGLFVSLLIFLARVCLSVRTATLLEGVINPWPPLVTHRIKKRKPVLERLAHKATIEVWL